MVDYHVEYFRSIADIQCKRKRGGTFYCKITRFDKTKPTGYLDVMSLEDVTKHDRPPYECMIFTTTDTVMDVIDKTTFVPKTELLHRMIFCSGLKYDGPDRTFRKQFKQ